MNRKATRGDLDAVEQIYTELLTHERNGVSYSNWQLDLYPTEETARKALEEETLFVLEEEGEICASVILNQEQADFYNEIPWRFEAAPNEVFVIHTLCVPPSRSGKGYATALIDFAKEYAAGRTGASGISSLKTSKNITGRTIQIVLPVLNIQYHRPSRLPTTEGRFKTA